MLGSKELSLQTPTPSKKWALPLHFGSVKGRFVQPEAWQKSHGSGPGGATGPEASSLPPSFPPALSAVIPRAAIQCKRGVLLRTLPADMCNHSKW